MTLPRKIEKPPRFNMAKRIRSPGHLKFVRGHACCACGSGENIHAHHVRLGTHSPLGAKPDDFWAVSLCGPCHASLHMMGESTFQKKHSIDLLSLAREFAAKSRFRNKWK